MSVLLLAQIIALVLTGLLALGLIRRLRATQARRAAAFEDFAEGRGLQFYRVAGATPVYRLTDSDGTIVTVEAAPAPAFALRKARKPGTVTVALPAPRLTRGFAALVAGLDAAGPDRSLRLERAMRGVGRVSGSEALSVTPVGDAMALMADIPAEATPDLEAIAAALADPALRPAAGGTAMIALNPEGLHLRLSRSITHPDELAAILAVLRRLGLRLGAGRRRQAA